MKGPTREEVLEMIRRLNAPGYAGPRALLLDVGAGRGDWREVPPQLALDIVQALDHAETLIEALPEGWPVMCRYRAPEEGRPDELLGVQGVAAGAVEDGPLDLSGEDGLLQEIGDEPGGLGLRKG